MNDLVVLAEGLFETISCTKVCLLNEISLMSSSTLSASESAVIVDIGARRISAYPAYEGIIMRNAVRTTSVGGEHCTEYMEWLLAAQRIEAFSSQLPRRRRAIARRVKESCCFVAESFESSRAKYGSFAFDFVKVMGIKGSGGGGGDAEEEEEMKKLGRAALSNTVLAASKDIRCSADVSLPNGTVLPISVDRERFYASEVLFQPSSMLEGFAASTLGLAECILQAVEAVDSSVRDEICGTILIAGGSAALPGLVARLQRDLTPGMASLGLPRFRVLLAEPNSNSAAPSSSSFPSSSSSAFSLLHPTPLPLSSCEKGANVRLRNAFDASLRAPLETQNFVTADDYEEMGSEVLHLVLVS